MFCSSRISITRNPTTNQEEQSSQGEESASGPSGSSCRTGAMRASSCLGSFTSLLAWGMGDGTSDAVGEGTTRSLSGASVCLMADAENRNNHNHQKAYPALEPQRSGLKNKQLFYYFSTAFPEFFSQVYPKTIKQKEHSSKKKRQRLPGSVIGSHSLPWNQMENSVFLVYNLKIQCKFFPYLNSVSSSRDLTKLEKGFKGKN